MADNNMNISNTPEQELDLDQLEQVSGGCLRSREKAIKLQPASGGIMPVAGGDSLQATGGVLKPFHGGSTNNNGEGSGMG